MNTGGGDVNERLGVVRLVEPTTRQRLILWMIAFGMIHVLWALSNPTFASPDEPAHIVRAQGISNLDFTPPYRTDGVPTSAIECVRFQPDVTADCMDLTWGVAGTEVAVPTDGYPPLLHAVAAIPATVLDGLTGVYAMRAWLSLITAAMFAWSAVLALSGGVWRLTGLLIGLTPSVTFFSSTVNPSGLTASGVALATTSVLALNDRSSRPNGPIAGVIVGILAVAGTRRDGLAWLVVLAVVAAVYTGALRRTTVRALWERSRRSGIGVRVGGSTLALVVALIAVLWGVPGVWRFISRRETADRSLWEAARAVRIYIDHLFGVFGWLDSTMGLEAFMIALVVAGGLITLALMSGQGRPRSALVLSLAFLIAVPIGFGAIRYPYFQGRYLIPMWIVTGLIAGSTIARSPHRTLRPTVLLGLWGVVHAWSLLNNLKRYAVGRNGNWSELLSESAWHPPMMSNAVVLVLTAGTALLWIGVVGRSLATSGDNDER